MSEQSSRRSSFFWPSPPPPPRIPMKNRARYNRSSLIPEPSPPARQLYPPSEPEVGSIRALLVDSDGSSATLEFRGVRAVDAQPPVNTWENVEPQCEKEQDARQDSFRSYVKHWSEIRRQNLVRCGGRKVIFLLFNSLFTSVFLAILLFTVFVYTHSTPLLTTIHLIRPDLLFLMTMISGLATFVGLLGFLGAFLHRKGVISTYDILLWLVLGGCVAIGYMAFHDEHGSGYDSRLSARWDVYGNWRGLVQTRYGCCGFDDPLDRPLQQNGQCNYVGARPVPPDSNTDPFAWALRTADMPFVRSYSLLEKHARLVPMRSRRQDTHHPSMDPTFIPGCATSWSQFTRTFLKISYITAFSLLPFILVVFIIGLLTGNRIYH